MKTDKQIKEDVTVVEVDPVIAAKAEIEAAIQGVIERYGVKVIIETVPVLKVMPGQVSDQGELNGVNKRQAVVEGDGHS